jgi:UDP:flavonoid glycosyltransferase YjiC (YdhE family)
MRILLATYDCYSHVTTALPLVQRLVRRGHTVRWLVDQRFGTFVGRAGAELVPTVHVPSHADLPAMGLDEWITMFRAERYAQAADLLYALDEAPTDLLLVDPTYAGVEELGDRPDLRLGMLGCVPLLHIHPGVQFVLQATLPQMEYPVGEPLRSRVFFTGPLLPPPMDELSPEEQGRYAERIPTDRPLVLITHGTLATDPAMLAQPALDALRDLPVFALVQARPGTLDLPANAMALPWLPFGRLLPHTSLLVSNGGYQGAQWGLAAGVPMVIHGQTEDKPEVGKRVEWAGYGKDLSGGPASPESFRRGIVEVLTNPRYREQAHRLARQAALHDPATAAAQIIEMHAPVKGEVARAA